MEITQEEYNEMEERYNRLLDEEQRLFNKLYNSTIVVKKEFESNGEYVITGGGVINQWASREHEDFYNSWKTEEIAKAASKQQRIHNAMLNYVAQNQEIGYGDYYVYKENDGVWEVGYKGSNLYPDTVNMLKSTAEEMVKDIKSGYFPLEKLFEGAK